MTLRKPPAESATVEQIGEWCNEAEQHLRSLGFPGYPPDIGIQLAVRGLASALAIPGDELDAHIAVARLRFMVEILPGAEEAARRSKLLGGLQLPPNGNRP